jgi:hypothetical protein
VNAGVIYDIEWDPPKGFANFANRGVAFEDAATVFLDPLALTVYDVAHSDEEERSITMGLDYNGTLLVVSHTFQYISPLRARMRLISAPEPTRTERFQYQELPR